jgi:hypothetical protein
MESTNSKRFKRLCQRFGYRVVPITSRINGMFERRPDVMGVDNHGEFVMVVPARIYGFPIMSYKDLLGATQPDYFACEKTLLMKHYGKKI